MVTTVVSMAEVAGADMVEAVRDGDLVGRWSVQQNGWFAIGWRTTMYNRWMFYRIIQHRKIDHSQRYGLFSR